MYDAKEVARIRYSALWVCAAAWILLVVGSDRLPAFPYCRATSSAIPLSWASAPIAEAGNQTVDLAMNWVLMWVVMMAPGLVLPICHVRAHSLRRRGVRMTAMFLAGDLVAWMVFAALEPAVELPIERFAPPSSYMPAAAVAVIALVWQCSPVKQRFLNRGLAHPELGAFGLAAHLDVFRFGVTHGLWCVGSCWAWMLFPMLLPRWQWAAMAMISALFFCERLERAAPPSWRWRGFGKAIRIAVAQTRIRWSDTRRSGRGSLRALRARASAVRQNQKIFPSP